jgi:REP element-mobilizing transposase RayT
VVDEAMRLNEYGQMAEQCWLDIPNHFPHADLDAFVVMPNHIHGIVVITDNVGANNYSPLRTPSNDHSSRTAFQSPSKTIGAIVRGFKIGVTKWFRQHTNTFHVWQRNYYEHVIRDADALDHIRRYIEMNPMQWTLDRENPEGRPIAAVRPWEH